MIGQGRADEDAALVLRTEFEAAKESHENAQAIGALAGPLSSVGLRLEPWSRSCRSRSGVAVGAEVGLGESPRQLSRADSRNLTLVSLRASRAQQA